MKILKIHSRVHGTKEVILDDEDYYLVTDYKWVILKSSGNNTFYARRTEYYANGESKSILMHRFISDVIDDNSILIDHKNLNGLDNRRENLRKCTRSQNAMNTRAWGASKYLGVTIRKENGKHRATIRVNGNLISLGTFPATACGELLAALTYDIWAEHHHKEFANLNFKPL